KLWLFICFFMSYLGLVNITYPSAETPSFYIENLYLPLSIFLALPVIFDLLPALEKKKLAIPFIAMVVTTGVIRIYSAHSQYPVRLNYERSYLDKYGTKKMIIKANEADHKTFQMLWGTPYEFLLLSESERHPPPSRLFSDPPGLAA